MNFRITFLFLILEFSTTLFQSVDWISNTKKLKERVNKFYHKPTTSTAESVSAGSRPFGSLDYPGNDQNKLQIIESIWNEYYECLRSRNVAMGSEKVMPPYIISTFIQTSVELDCNICISPEDTAASVEWYFKDQLHGVELVLVEEDEYKQISAYTFALTLFNIQSFHQGMYYCKVKDYSDAPHILHVLNSNEEPITEVKPALAKKGPYPKSILQIPQTNIIVRNEWTEWSSCSVCGTAGKRNRIGYCKLSLLQTLPDVLKSTVQVPSVTTTNIPQVVQEVEELLKTTKYGIPCRSPLLPKEIRENNIIKNFSTEVMTGFCKIRCPADVIEEIKDEKGNVIGQYNNSAGEYGPTQELPAMPTGPERVTIYANLGQPFIIFCPNNLHKNAPIEWSVGGKIWLKHVVESVSNGRISINSLNEIVFHSVEEVDVKIYSCWQQKELVGVVRLFLNRQPSYLIEYITTLELYPMIMYMAITCTFTYVAIKMFINRQKAKIGAIVGRKKGSKKYVEFLKDSYTKK